VLRLLLIVAAFIVYGSLYPFQFDFGRTDANPLTILLHTWPARVDRFLWRDACVNVLLYFPLGLTAVLVLMRRLPRAAAALATVVLGTGLSASIEMLQIFDSSRTCSLLDVACNFAGTVGGVIVALIFRQEIFGITRRRIGDRGAAGALLLACCWAGYQLYPFIPLFSTYRLRDHAARFLATPISTVEVCAAAAEWFAFALVMRAVTGRLKAPWLLLAMGCLPLRLLIVERTLAPSELLGAALTMLAWTWPTDSSRIRAGAGVLAAAIVLRELSPFAFTAPAHAMSWIPFAATLDAERLNAALILLRKAFEYGTLVWLLRASGLRYWSAGLWVAAGLMLLETAQRYLPGRQPEVTDAVIAGILALILWGSERRVTRSITPTFFLFSSP
jgi:VanZ family protein